MSSLARGVAVLIAALTLLPMTSVSADPAPRDPFNDGTRALVPTHDVAAVKAQQARVTAVGAPLPVYEQDGYVGHDVSDARLAYNDELASRDDPGVHDASGVRMFRFANTTTLWNHPVGQAQWGLRNLATYRVTGDEFYLDRAVLQAERNLTRRVESRGAWWYPYDFDAARCATAPTMRAPWYSAMAQGQLLSLFVRLHQYTHEARWREAADRTFDSLTLAPDDVAPWATWVDESGYRWLEEYPHPTMTGERVMNGHIFAIYGVYDYWRLTHDERAAAALDGAITTVRRYLPDPIRLPGWASRYSLGCLNPHLGYHLVHTGQALRLYEITQHGRFADLASTLRADYPRPWVAATVQFKAGEHTGFKFSSGGELLETKDVTLPAASRAPADQRVRVRGLGVFYKITAGAFAGYLVPEQYPDRVLLGTHVQHRYSPLRELAFAPRTYTAYAYDKFGNTIASKVEVVEEPVTQPLVATAIVNGRLSYLPAAGPFKGWWMAATSGLSVR